MLFVEETGERGPLLVLVHWLGGSSRTWNEVCEGLSASGIRCAAVDLPGFGHAAATQDFSVPTMATALVKTVRSLRENDTQAPWFLAGHSMGGKLAAIVARAAEDGAEGLEKLRGIVLVSPSPPDPEPMKESKRAEMLQSLGEKSLDAATNRAHAERFVDDNTGNLPLVHSVRERSIEDVLRMNPYALTAWLNTGSKEDWSAHVGVLETPALVLAGTEDAALGPDAQKAHTLPHFSRATLVSLEGGGHLAPLERPGEVIDQMLEYFRDLGTWNESSDRPLGKDFAALIDSDRTSPQTRKVLMERITDGESQQGALLPDERRILRALVARIVPEAGFDLAHRVDKELAQKKGDGWRFAALPQDAEAWKKGLFSLDAAAKREFGVPFIALDSARQDGLLQRAQQGKLGAGLLAAVHLGESADAFNAAQMRDWFEDVRATLSRLYVADPRTMERIGFIGFADEQGFTQIRLSEQEDIEL